MVNIKQLKPSKKLGKKQAGQVQRYESVINACELKTNVNGEGNEYYCLQDNCPRELRDLFLAEFEVRDIDYSIFSYACDFISEYSLKELASEEDYENAISDYSFASVYTGERLSYLNIHNQDEITDKVKEYGCDIQEACAYWYDEECRRAVGLLKDYILNSHD